MVFQELAPAQQAKKSKDRADLEAELFSDDARPIRDNEGEAAEHGIYFDDTGYDYMQHMRDLGGGTEATWVEASAKEKGKGKQVSLDEALKELDIGGGQAQDQGKAKLTGESILPSTSLRERNYQDQQDIPDALAGFQPDMDPRLREALEALEDEAYVDSEAKDDSFFADIAEDGEEISLEEFEELGYDPEGGFEDDGWSTDDTAKPDEEYKSGAPVNAGSSNKVPLNLAEPLELPDSGITLNVTDRSIPPDSDHGDGDFMASFRNLPKSVEKSGAADKAEGASASIMTGASALTAGGRKKKRKGARTSSDTYSMTSSSLFRTEGLELLDRRFDKTMETYMEEDEDEYPDDTASIVTGNSNVSGLSDVSGISGVSRSSRAPNLVVRKDFDDIMDDFLGGYSMAGKKRVKKGKYQTGMQQLDEIRRELGRPIGRSVGAQAGTSS